MSKEVRSGSAGQTASWGHDVSRAGYNFLIVGDHPGEKPMECPPSTLPGNAEVAFLQDRVDQLVRAYRVRGHMIARIDPLELPRPSPPELDPSYYGLTDAHMDRPFSTLTVPGLENPTLRAILELLRSTYCRWIGVQYMHIDDLEARWWLRDAMERTQNRLDLTREEQVRILTRLTDAVIFEEFLQKKYLGAKTFSLEGAESLIPLLDLAIEKAGEHGVEEIVLGMAHRGRLNVLANILGKSPRAIFREFEDVDGDVHRGHGDVKHHLGHSTNWVTQAGRRVHLSLCFNPSHLEFVDPVVLGRVRAKQDRVGDAERVRGMALVIHGEAAFCGGGMIQETLNLSELEAYGTGGTIHVLVNNQLGFTTPPSEGRSSVYATDVAKMLQIPIFHVNGENPEAVAQVVMLGMEFRRTFRRDVVIDMYAYRRRGHNEGDEPSFTQPSMYRAIEARKPVREGYLEHLLALGGVSREEADAIAEDRRERLERDLAAARTEEEPAARDPRGVWSGYHGGRESARFEVTTGVDAGRLAALLEALTRAPADFHVHPKLQRGLARRVDMARGAQPLDWSAAEALAFATLATEGIRVRMSGQDTVRGTFSQRHARFHDVEDEKTYIPLQHLSPDQAAVEIFNSPLSEEAVLGFEYGYSLDCPGGLVLWEAQFGDFCNAAQVIVDQFIVSAEQKWRRLSGIVLLLPHGFEGMGPEHSSARLERFLSLAAEDNIQIVNPTTPAQYFHCLRRQALRRWRKPLVVMTPKSLLRHPAAVSSLEDLARGFFRTVIADAPDALDVPDADETRDADFAPARPFGASGGDPFGGDTPPPVRSQDGRSTEEIPSASGGRPDIDRASNAGEEGPADAVDARRSEEGAGDPAAPGPRRAGRGSQPARGEGATGAAMESPRRRETGRVLLCSGKIFHELDRYRRDEKRGDVAIVRVEQLYPLPREALRAALGPYARGTPVIWVQEEPENMGAWRFLRLALGASIDGRLPLSVVCRRASSSPATGSASSHALEQKDLLSRAFGPLTGGVKSPWLGGGDPDEI